MSTKVHKYVLARHIDRALYTHTLPEAVTAQATELVAAIDAGKGGIPARAEALVASAWMAAARTAARAVKPTEQRKALAQIRAVGELEDQLGLAPVGDTADEPETEPVADPDPESAADTAVAKPETEPEADTAGDTESGSYSYGSGYTDRSAS